MSLNPASNSSATTRHSREQKVSENVGSEVTLGMIASATPRLVYKSLTQGNFRLLAFTLDMAAPPLTLLGMLLSMTLLVSGFDVLLALPQLVGIRARGVPVEIWSR